MVHNIRVYEAEHCQYSRGGDIFRLLMCVGSNVCTSVNGEFMFMCSARQAGCIRVLLDDH